MNASKGLVSGMAGFSTMWAGQLVSLLGSAMSRFAITVWAWQETGQASSLALIGFFSFAPTVLLSPLAGALVDRWSRKLVLILSDVAAALSTVMLLLFHMQGILSLGHVFMLGMFASAFEAFQLPALTASISMMVDQRNYARANAMHGSVRFASSLAAPALASTLLVLIGLRGILLIDLCTFACAMGTLAVVRIPRSRAVEVSGKSRLRDDILAGFRYVRTRPSLLWLIGLLFVLNLPGAAAMITFPALILARTGDNEIVLGISQSFMGVGGVAGGIAVAIFASRIRDRMRFVLWTRGIRRVAAFLVLGIAQHPILWCLGAFSATFFSVVATSVNTSMLQSKVPNEMQGRFFSLYRVVGQLTIPLGFLLAGPLVDHVLEPGMRSDTGLSRLLGPLVGTGPGAGMGTLFFICALFGVLTCVVAFAVRSLRELETTLPDREVDKTIAEEK